MSLYDERLLQLYGNIPKLNILVGCNGFAPDAVKQTCTQLGICDYIDFFSILPETYSTWDKNQHHWTTNFVWNNVIPRIMDFLGIVSYQDKFTKVKFFSNGNDISYHNWNHNNTFKFICLTDKYELNGKFDILRDITTKRVNDNVLTDYHRLFTGAHRDCIIKNENPNNNTKLVINGDSMTIPIIPIIAPFVSEIFVQEHHMGINDIKLLKEFKPTHYLMCNVVLNLFNGNIIKKVMI